MWLIPPSTSCPCVPESTDLASDCDWLFPMLEKSAWSRGKPLRAQVWSRLWKRAGFTRLLSGWATSQSLTPDLGAEWWIASQAPIPVSPIRSRASDLGAETSVSSSTKSFASLKSAGLLISGARTCRGTRTDSSQPSSRHWSDWATALRQEYSARPKPEIPCGASDCSSWPLPMAGTNVPNGGRSTAHAEQVGATLYHEGKKVQMGLESQVRQWSAPMAADARGSAGVGKEELPNQAALFHPPSSQDQPIAGGSTSSTTGPNSNQPSVKRKLNPIFVEALMRWPTGLSGFERQEMASIQSQPRIRFCASPSAFERWFAIQSDFLGSLLDQHRAGADQMDLFGAAAGGPAE